LKETIIEAKANDVLELDEVWAFVYCSANKRWLWTALCRRTKQMVAFVSGDHSAKTCAKLWAKLPASYKHCHSFSDFWVRVGSRWKISGRNFGSKNPNGAEASNAGIFRPET
jgi:IS1 family transposase